MRAENSIPELQTFIDAPSSTLAFEEVMLIVFGEDPPDATQVKEESLNKLEAILAATEENNGDLMTARDLLMKR